MSSVKLSQVEKEERDSILYTKKFSNVDDMCDFMAKNCMPKKEVEKKKLIPFIIESDSEEESDEESDEKQDECCGCGEKFYWRMLNYSSDDKGTLYCDDCMPESDDESDEEGEFKCSECGCDGMYAPDDTCSKCLVYMYGGGWRKEV